MTFFLQVALPHDHPWTGWTVALFSCTACLDQTPNRFLSPGPENWTWQEASERGIVVDERFIAGAQRHRSLVVNTASDVVVREDISAHIAFRALDQRQVGEPYVGMKVGGVPSWRENNVIYELATYKGERLTFLFQVPGRPRFSRLPTAPLRNDFFQGSHPTPPEELEQRYFDLFSGNPAFCFGTTNRVPPAAFLIPSSSMAANVKSSP
jgi:hypothetical protein